MLEVIRLSLDIDTAIEWPFLHINFRLSYGFTVIVISSLGSHIASGGIA